MCNGVRWKLPHVVFRGVLGVAVGGLMATSRLSATGRVDTDLRTRVVQLLRAHTHDDGSLATPRALLAVRVLRRKTRKARRAKSRKWTSNT